MPFPREMVRQVKLVFPQEAEAEVPGPAELFDVGNRMAKADQDERRFERYGSERTDGEAVRDAAFVHNGGYSHPGCKAAAGMTEGFRRNWRHPAFDTLA
jgi:hypothetical protein